MTKPIVGAYVAVDTVRKMVSDVAWLKWLSATGGAILGYMFPDSATANAALGAAILILLDTITGVLAAWHNGKKITSLAFSRTLSKLFGYASVVLVCSVVSKHIPGLSGVQAASVSGVVYMVIATEALSVLENVHQMGIKLPFGLNELLRKFLSGAEKDK